jgi:hypothetical protein
MSSLTVPLISLSGIVIAAFVAFYVAYLQRRQMRQIEAHRLDPTVPLKPPFAPVWQWTIRHFALIGTTIAIVNLTTIIIDPRPLTKLAALDIALNVAMIVFCIILDIIRFLAREYGEMFMGLTRLIESSSRFVVEVGKATIENQTNIREVTRTLTGDKPKKSPDDATTSQS